MAVNNNPSHQNLDGVSGREVTPEEIAQRDGYVRGRSDENSVQNSLRGQDRAVAQAQANDNAASGLVFGLIIALLAAGVGAAVYFLSGDRTAPVAVPQIERQTTTEKETTIIEKDSPAPAVSLPDVQIDVPQVEAPAVPDINITNQEPAAPAADPVAEPAAEPPAEIAPEAVGEPAN